MRQGIVMRRRHNNSLAKYLLVLCLSITLLLSQTGNLHMHLVHADHAGSSTHLFELHPESNRHDPDLSNHHDGHPNDHSTFAVDVSPETLLKNTKLLNLLFLIIFLSVFLLRIPPRTSVNRQQFCKTLFPPCYYLFHPPLRAPPIH